MQALAHCMMPTLTFPSTALLCLILIHVIRGKKIGQLSGQRSNFGSSFLISTFNMMLKKKQECKKKETTHNGEKHRRGTIRVAIKKGNLKLVSPEKLTLICL